ncbi:Transposable element P transposase [Paramuricea clavata]|uniref:Transposable element P transposase n=1 Tax=Paramuricea clavata TaxID=317549 RepID=A0A7D9DWW0_PARCT|nr:Transposable element P transposase [Paramuricea clavata]
MSGKHYNRNVRSHKVVYEALVRLLFQQYLESLTPAERDETVSLIENLAETFPSEDYLPQVMSENFGKLEMAIAMISKSEADKKTTFALWLNYIQMLPCPRVGDGQETKASKEIARKEWLHVILRTREMTPELKQRINKNKIFLCERHFKAELISDHGKRKLLETGAVPTENLPLKSHETKPSTRWVLERQQEAGPSTSASPPVAVEKKETFEEFCSNVKGVTLDPWSITACTNDEMRIELQDSKYSISKFVLIIDSCLHFSLHVYNWLLPDDHKMYSSRRRRMNSAEIAELLLSLHNGEFKICKGLRQNEYLNSIAKDVDTSHQSFAILYQQALVWIQITELW